MPTSSVAIGQYPVAALYPVALMRSCDARHEPQTSAETRSAVANNAKRDLRELKSLGFSAVAYSHALQDEFEILAETAREAGMHVMHEPRSFAHFTQDGRRAPTMSAVELPVGQAVKGETGNTAHDHFILARSDSEQSVRRADRIRTAAVSRGENCCIALRDFPAPSLNGDNIPDRSASVLSKMESPPACVINFAAVTAITQLTPHRNESPPMESTAIDVRTGLLSSFHDKVTAGLTGGLLLDGLFTLPGEPASLLSSHHRDRVATRAAVKALLQRAEAWSSHISNARVRRLSRPEESQSISELTWTLLESQGRSHLIVHNTALDSFQRMTPRLETIRALDRFDRAVEVNQSSVRPGNVFMRNHTGWLLRLDLAPGDAALFELF